MPLRIVKIAELEEVNAFLRGGVVGGIDLRTPRDRYFLDGKTIVFTAPVGTVTFATPNATEQEPLTLLEIITQINAVHAGLARAMSGRLHLELPAPGVITATGGTALPFLGFDDAGFSTLVIDKPGGAQPSVESIFTSPLSGGTYILLLNEA